MRKILLSGLLLFLALNVPGQEVNHEQIRDRIEQAGGLVLDGNRAEAADQFRQIAQLCRQQGGEFLAEELDALYSLCNLSDDTADKKALLQEMKERAGAVTDPAHPARVQGYLTLAESEVAVREGRQADVLDPISDAFGALFKDPSEEQDGRLLRAALLTTVAEFAYEQGLYENAINLYEGAEEALGEPVTRMERAYLGNILTYIGGTYSELARFDEARACLERARRELEQAGAARSRYYAYLLVNSGSLQGRTEGYTQATKVFRQALDLVPETSPDRAEILMVYLAGVINTGDLAAVDAGMKEAMQLSESVQLRPQWWISYYQCLSARNMLSGHAKESVDATEKAIALAEKEHINNPRLVSSLYSQLAANYTMLGDDDLADTYTQLAQYVLAGAYGEDMTEREAARKGTENALSQTGRLLDEAMQDMASGRFEQALKKTDEMLDLYAENGVVGLLPLSAESTKLVVLECIGDEKRLKKAADQYLTDLRNDVRLNLSYMTEAERETYYAGVMPYIGYAYLAESKPSLAEPVYNSVLLRKNFILGAGISLERLIAGSGDDSLQGILAEMKALRSGPAADRDLPSGERLAAVNRANALENELVRKSHDYGDFLSLSDIRWEDVRDALSSDEAAVEFIQAGSDEQPVYCALVLRSGWKRPRCVALIGDDEQFLLTLAEPEYTEFVYGDPTLYGVFWAPLEKMIKPGDKVYFAMDGFLNAFAFEHFVTEKGERAMDRYELHRVSSTRELIGRKQEVPERSAALFGGFDYNLSGEEVSYYASLDRSGAGDEEWGYLPGSLAEVEEAERILEGRMDVSLYTAEEGLESRFKALSGQAPDLIHIATHGYYFDGKSDPMERSGLVFSGANALKEEGPAESGEDGLLKSSEIALLDLRGTDLIVLSACQSGVGSISSDGVYGLQRAFKKAGVRSILMSLWKVDDKVTAEMMQLFYTALSSGQDSRAAFRSARETLRKTYPDPLLWAPFVLLES